MLSAGGSDLWYGMGLVAGSFTGFTIAYFRLRFMERHMDEHIFCGGQLFTVKRERMPEYGIYKETEGALVYECDFYSADFLTSSECCSFWGHQCV